MRAISMRDTTSIKLRIYDFYNKSTLKNFFEHLFVDIIAVLYKYILTDYRRERISLDVKNTKKWVAEALGISN